jgi:Protein required for attachment to host cells
MFHVVIADRKQLRVLEETTAQGPLRELAVLHNPDKSTHERDLVSDRSGRTASSASGARQEYGRRVSARQEPRARAARRGAS